MFSKKRWLIAALLLSSIYIIWGQSSTYGELINISGTNQSPLTLYRESNEKLLLNEGDRFAPNETLIVQEGQTIELVIYRENRVSAFIVLNENSDLKFSFSGERLILKSNFGQVRVVPTEETEVSAELENVKVEGKGGDFGLIAEIDEESTHKGYAISFSDEITISPLKGGESKSLNKWELAEYSGLTLNEPALFSRKELDFWQDQMSHKELGLPVGPDLVMEGLDIFNKDKESTEPEVIEEEPELPDEPEAEETEEIVSEEPAQDETTDLVMVEDATTDEEPKKDARSQVARFFISMLSHEIGIISYDRDIAFRLVSRPGMSLFDDKFEFGFYFPLALIPSKIFTNEAFLKLNQSNSEWSFGTDQQGDPGKITYDIFDDLLLKLRVLRYNHEDSPVFVYAGEYLNISDDTNFSFFNFKSEIFYPVLRSTSFITRFNLPFFRASIYAEDILPRGIYGTDFHFMNPSQSFKVSGGISTYFDCYELSQEITAPANQERYIPAHINGHFKFTVFDLPSYDFSMHLNGGTMIPLSYNFSTGQSGLNSLLAANPSALGATIAVNSGVRLRVKKFIFGADLIVDSELNKVGLFDALYNARRDFRNSQISSWISELSGRAIDISDFNFGSRIKMGFKFTNYALFEASYQITFTYDANNAANPLAYYDKLYLNLKLNSQDKWKKFNAGLIFQWQLESMITSFQALGQQNWSGFLTNQVLYAGIFFQPYPGVKVNAKYGMFPNFSAGSSGWKMLFDLYLSFTPKIDIEKLRANFPKKEKGERFKWQKKKERVQPDESEPETEENEE